MISLVILVESRDLDKVPDSLHDISRQTILPDEVIVAVLDREKSPLPDSWKDICPVPISSETDGPAQCTGDIVVLTTVGIQYHPKKMEITRDMFRQHPCTKLLVHSHGPVMEQGTENILRIKPGLDLTFAPPPSPPTWNSPRELEHILYHYRVPVCHGHSAFSRSVFDPSQAFVRGLDVKYCRRLLCEGSSDIVQIENVLQTPR
jgi:hypothetical protein